MYLCKHLCQTCTFKASSVWKPLNLCKAWVAFWILQVNLPLQALSFCVSLKDRDGAVTWAVRKPADSCLKSAGGELNHSVSWDRAKSFNFLGAIQSTFFVLPSTWQHCAIQDCLTSSSKSMRSTCECQAASPGPTRCSKLIFPHQNMEVS